MTIANIIQIYQVHRKTFLTVKRMGIIFLILLVLLGRFSYADNTSVSIIENYQQALNGLSTDFLDEVKSRFEEIEGKNGNTGLLATIESQYGANVRGTIANIAILIMGIMVLISIIQEAQRGEMTMEIWLKILITMAVGLWLIVSSGTILNAVNSLGNDIVTRISGSVSSSNGNTSEITSTSRVSFDDLTYFLGSEANARKVIEAAGESVSDGKTYDIEKLKEAAHEANIDTSVMVEGSTASFVAGCLKLAPMILIAIMDGMVYMLAIQMLIRSIFLPLAIVDLSSEGIRGNGMRYIKRYLALYIQKGIYYVVAGMSTTIIHAALTGEVANQGMLLRCFMYCVGLGTCIGMMSQAGAVANEIVGG